MQFKKRPIEVKKMYLTQKDNLKFSVNLFLGV